MKIGKTKESISEEWNTLSFICNDEKLIVHSSILNERRVLDNGQTNDNKGAI